MVIEDQSRIRFVTYQEIFNPDYIILADSAPLEKGSLQTKGATIISYDLDDSNAINTYFTATQMSSIVTVNITGQSRAQFCIIRYYKVTPGSPEVKSLIGHSANVPESHSLADSKTFLLEKGESFFFNPERSDFPDKTGQLHGAQIRITAIPVR